MNKQKGFDQKFRYPNISSTISKSNNKGHLKSTNLNDVNNMPNILI